MFDWAKEKAELVAHLAWMASMPGAKAHAWFRANDMARKEPELYGDMPYLLTVAMSERKAAMPIARGLR